MGYRRSERIQNKNITALKYIVGKHFILPKEVADHLE
jgi:hypothetical protein